jgi:hypothetical protein
MFMSFIEEADVGNSADNSGRELNGCMQTAAKLLNNTVSGTNQSFETLFIGMNRLPFAHTSTVDYELYLAIDLIGGIINIENRGNTECRYKDASIGDYIENATIDNPNIARPARFFIKTHDTVATETIKK